MKRLNQNMKRRDLLLAPYFVDKNYLGGVRAFWGLDVLTAHKLLQEGFADPKDRQNMAPSFNEFLMFMVENPSYKAHGYTVHKDRGDYRVTIEGLEAKTPTPTAVKAFRKFSHDADNLTDTYSWYD